MITLRGHHLQILRDYVACRNNPSKILEEDCNFKESMTDTHGYSQKFADNLVEVAKKGLNPNEKIRVVEELDDICACCSIRYPACLEKSNSSGETDDRKTARYYGLQIGRIYNAPTVHRKLMAKRKRKIRKQN